MELPQRPMAWASGSPKAMLGLHHGVLGGVQPGEHRGVGGHSPLGGGDRLGEAGRLGCDRI